MPSVMGEIKNEWERLKSYDQVIKKRLQSSEIKILILLYGVAYTILMALGGASQLDIWPAPILLLLVIIVDGTVESGFSKTAESHNPEFESLMLYVIPIAGLIVASAFWSLELVGSSLEERVFSSMSRYLVLWFLAVIPVFLMSAAGRYMLESIGVTNQSKASAWILILVMLSIFFSQMPVTVLRQGSNLSPEIVLIGITIQMILVLFFNAFPEELLFRGALQSRLVKSTGSGMKGIILAALAFASFHIPRHAFDQDVLGGNFLATFLYCFIVYGPAGIAFGIVKWRTGSLKWSIAAHTIYNLRTSIFSGLLIVLFFLG